MPYRLLYYDIRDHSSLLGSKDRAADTKRGGERRSGDKHYESNTNFFWGYIKTYIIWILAYTDFLSTVKSNSSL